MGGTVEVIMPYMEVAEIYIGYIIDGMGFSGLATPGEQATV